MTDELGSRIEACCTLRRTAEAQQAAGLPKRVPGIEGGSGGPENGVSNPK